MADGRWYTFENDSRKYVSVTTFLGIIGKQQFLMPWAAKMERELVRLLIKDSGPDAEETIEKLLEYIEPKKPYGYQLYTEDASEFGSTIHRAIDYTLKDLKLPKLTKAERKVYDKWKEWWAGTGYSLSGAERVVKSTHYGYAGTLDALALKEDQKTVLDWKTGKNHYDEHCLQNLAYQFALLEETVLATGGLLVYIPKDKEIWTVPVPQVTDELMKPVLAALDLWRWANKKPAWRESEKAHD